MAAGNCMGIPECLPWKTYQGGSESLNPFGLFSSCKYSCFQRSAYVSRSRPWGSGASPSHPQDQSKVILRSRLQGTKVENWDWEEGIYNIGQMGKAAMAHAWCLSWIFPKRSGFILSHCVKRKDLLLVWGSLSKWTSAKHFCLSLAVSP